MRARQYLGRGWSLPLAADRDGLLTMVDGPEKVRQSIAIILDTEPGERIMRPSFGCGLRRYLMKPNTTVIITDIYSEEWLLEIEAIAVE